MRPRPAPELARRRTSLRRRPVSLHLPQPGPLSVAVVLGLGLCRHRLAALRSHPFRARAALAAGRPARGRLHRTHDLLERTTVRLAPVHVQHHLGGRDDDREHSAAAAGLGMAHRRRGPGRGAAHRAHGLAAFPLLVQRNRRMGYDLRRIAAAGGPVCCEVTTNVLYNLSRLAMGQPSLTEALIRRTYDAEEGLFLPVARPQPRRRPATTIAALTPLALPDLPE